MKTVVIGIDGLEKSIIDKYIDRLPGFQLLRDKGNLHSINTIFPADSVPAWLTIFTGLNPAGHGIIRGKDYVESVEDYENTHTFNLEGNTFWDKIAAKGKKCLILNPFLAYPAWNIHGEMISGPAFIDGAISITPSTAQTDFPHVYGGYSSVGTVAELKKDMQTAYDDTVNLWKDFEKKFFGNDYDMAFVTFTTLDRIQHYTWRYFDENDPLHEQDDFLSDMIPNTITFFDTCIQKVVSKMDPDDNLIIISDHGFCQRPYELINLNEVLRRAGLLVVNKEAESFKSIIKQKLKTRIIETLSRLHMLDIVLAKLKKVKSINKYKKSDFLIDKDASVCFVDQLFSGKKPYVGLTFGNKIKSLPIEKKRKYVDQINQVIKENKDIPQPLWIKLGLDLYQGKFAANMPDICLEFPPKYGVEFDMFGKTHTTSSTHYKLSGGHYGSSTFGFYNPTGNFKDIDSVMGVHKMVVTLFE